jgi:hypothetical protein
MSKDGGIVIVSDGLPISCNSMYAPSSLKDQDSPCQIGLVSHPITGTLVDKYRLFYLFWIPVDRQTRFYLMHGSFYALCICFFSFGQI